MFEEKYLKRIKRMGLKADSKGRFKRDEVEAAMAVTSSLWDSDSYELFEFADAWAGLGDAITEQVRKIGDGNREDFDQVNSNAIQEAQRRLKGYNEELDEILNDYMDWSLKD